MSTQVAYTYAQLCFRGLDPKLRKLLALCSPFIFRDTAWDFDMALEGG